MKPLRIISSMVYAFLLFSSAVWAGGEYSWMRDFNIKAEADPSGFRARLEARFKVGDMQVDTVLDHVEKPADAYMLLRLGEIARQPIEHVIERYKAEKGSGWGVLAKRLGIKPGSKDFHALKQGQDLYDGRSGAGGQAKSKNRGKEKK